MSRRDTIIIAVLINACLLVILFATSITKKEEPHYASNYESPVTPSVPNVQFEDIERTLVKEMKPVAESYPLSSQIIAQAPLQPVKAPLKQVKQVEEKPTPKVNPKPASKPVECAEITVKSGDYLERISRENGVSVSEIMSYNNLKTTQLKIGQVLKVPLKEPSKNNSAKLKVKQYIVKVGDTPWSIANDNKMPLDDLLKLNHLDKESSRRLKPGDTLYIH